MVMPLSSMWSGEAATFMPKASCCQLRLHMTCFALYQGLWSRSGSRWR